MLISLPEFNFPTIMKKCQVKSSGLILSILLLIINRVTSEIAWTQSCAKWTRATQWREVLELYEKWLLYLFSQHGAIRSWHHTASKSCGNLFISVRAEWRQHSISTGGNVFLKYWVFDQNPREASLKTNLVEYLEKLIGILGWTVQLCYGY